MMSETEPLEKVRLDSRSHWRENCFIRIAIGLNWKKSAEEIFSYQSFAGYIFSREVFSPFLLTDLIFTRFTADWLLFPALVI